MADDIVQAEKTVKDLTDLNAAWARTSALLWAREQIGDGPGRAGTPKQRADYTQQLEAKAKEWKAPDAEELALADELGKEGEAMARAYDAAAVCNIGGR